MRRGFSWLQAVLTAAGVLIVVAVLFPVFVRDRGSGHRPSCQSQLKQIGLALMQYTQDYDDQFPPRGLTPQQGWVQAVMPYTKSHPLFYCPSASTSPSDDPSQRNYTDYWMNRRLRGQRIGMLQVIPSTILGGDGNDGADQTDARYALGALPLSWLNDAHSPAYRHLDTLNLLFADGHVKAIKPGSIKASSQQGPSFAPK